MYLSENKLVTSAPPRTFGTPLYNRGFVFSDYRYGFNKKEQDDEIKGRGNSYDFGARIYDPRTGRWLSTDPQARKFANMSPFVGMGNNPIMFIDPDGEVIIVPNIKDRVAVVKLINSRSANTYSINAKGELYLVKKADANLKGYSTYYSAKLDAAIESNKTIDINIKNKIKSPTVGADGKMIKETGGATNVDKNAGGGVTYTVPDKDGHAPEAIIYISGNENKNIKDEKGKSLIDKPSDILAHELVGHAIPRVVGSDTGNAVENENKVRKQQGKGNDQKRAPEPKHVE